VAREALSSRLDGELTPPEETALDAHLAGCPTCAGHGAALARLHRRMRLRPAGAVPDLTAAITSSIGAAQGSGTPAPAPGRRTRGLLPPLDWPRAVLLVIAATQLLLALPLLVLGDDPGASTHVTRELGAFSVAFAAGLLVVVWQPHRAAGLLPVAAALTAAMAVSTVADLLAGRASVLAESHHAFELGGLVVLWAVARAWRAPARSALAGA
jgi:predicted anti-sigma-YlaC factor YlaD